MSDKAEKDTREWRCTEHQGELRQNFTATDGSFLVVPKSALTAALDRVESLERTIREGLALEDQAIAQRDEAEAKLTAAREERDAIRKRMEATRTALAEALDVITWGDLKPILRKHGRLS